METPIYWAASNGHTEIVKSLAPLTTYKWGLTPSSVAKNPEIRRIFNSYNTTKKRKSGSSTKPSKIMFNMP